MRIVVERRIAAPRDKVFAVMTDIASWPEVIGAIRSIEFLERAPHRPVGVGARFRETRIMFGQTATEEMTVAEIVPPERFVLTAHSHGTRYVAEHVLTADGADTILHLAFEGRPQTLLARLLGPIAIVMAGHLRRQLTSDLDDLARAIERDVGS